MSAFSRSTGPGRLRYSSDRSGAVDDAFLVLAQVGGRDEQGFVHGRADPEAEPAARCSNIEERERKRRDNDRRRQLATRLNHKDEPAPCESRAPTSPRRRASQSWKRELLQATIPARSDNSTRSRRRRRSWVSGPTFLPPGGRRISRDPRGQGPPPAVQRSEIGAAPAWWFRTRSVCVNENNRAPVTAYVGDDFRPRTTPSGVEKGTRPTESAVRRSFLGRVPL